MESGGGLGETGETGGDSLGERVCAKGKMKARDRGLGWLGTSVSKKGTRADFCIAVCWLPIVVTSLVVEHWL